MCQLNSTATSHHRLVSTKIRCVAISNLVPIAVSEIELTVRTARTPLTPVSALPFNTQVPTRLWSNIEGHNETTSLQTNENPRLVKGGGPLNYADPKIRSAVIYQPSVKLPEASITI